MSDLYQTLQEIIAKAKTEEAKQELKNTIRDYHSKGSTWLMWNI